MSKTMQAVSLNILGKEYKIACAPEEQEALIRSAQELDKQMRKIRDTGKVAGADRIAVLAALNLAAQDAGSSQKSLGDSNWICSRLIDMQQKIEKVLENP
jgi:cell division protein ZapA